MAPGKAKEEAVSRFRSIFLTALIVALAFLGINTAGCSRTQPEAIRYGEDNCAYCRMNIVDREFGSELINKKGKVFKFDSIECLAAFVKRADIPTDQIHSIWVTDFSSPEMLIAVPDATFVRSESMRSPMGMGLFGFSSAQAAGSFADEHTGTVLPWPDLEEVVAEAWLESE
jgi:copper chaperone NosL